MRRDAVDREDGILRLGRILLTVVVTPFVGGLILISVWEILGLSSSQKGLELTIFSFLGAIAFFLVTFFFLIFLPLVAILTIACFWLDRRSISHPLAFIIVWSGGLLAYKALGIWNPEWGIPHVLTTGTTFGIVYWA